MTDTNYLYEYFLEKENEDKKNKSIEAPAIPEKQKIKIKKPDIKPDNFNQTK